MLVSKVVVQVEVKDNKYEFLMPNNVPIQDCYDAAQLVAKELVEFSKHQNEAAEQAQERKEEDGSSKQG